MIMTKFTEPHADPTWRCQVNFSAVLCDKALACQFVKLAYHDESSEGPGTQKSGLKSRRHYLILSNNEQLTAQQPNPKIGQFGCQRLKNFLPKIQGTWDVCRCDIAQVSASETKQDLFVAVHNGQCFGGIVLHHLLPSLAVDHGQVVLSRSPSEWWQKCQGRAHLNVGRTISKPQPQHALILSCWSTSTHCKPSGPKNWEM